MTLVRPAAPGLLDGPAVACWAQRCVDELAVHRDELDALNVFPVADSDTGTNLLATLTAARRALTPEPTAGRALATLAEGALRGARGSSGAIVAQVLRGLAAAAEGHRVLTPAVLRAGLACADQLATAAVSDPERGTILTVLHRAADAAAVAQDADVLAVVAAAAGAAVLATTDQLPALGAARVVDAGGRGLELVLLALATTATGRAHEPVVLPAHHRTVRGPRPVPAYEVAYVVDGTDRTRVAALRSALERLGDSVVVGGDPAAVVHVHVHARDAGAAVEAGLAAGELHRISIELLDVATAQSAGRLLLSVVDGPRTAALVGAEGSQVLVAAPGCPAETVVAALVATGAAHVTLLPNGGLRPDVLAAAVVAARTAGLRVTVLPTASVVQGLAALAVHDPARDAEDDVVAMAEAAAATRRGQLHVAQGRGLTWVGECAPGDVLALVDDDVVLIETDQAAAGERLLDRLLGAGGELVTVLTGDQADPGLVAALTEHVEHAHRGVELVAYTGDGAGLVLALGVE